MVFMQRAEHPPRTPVATGGGGGPLVPTKDDRKALTHLHETDDCSSDTATTLKKTPTLIVTTTKLIPFVVGCFDGKLSILAWGLIDEDRILIAGGQR
jgi:hypothetical protein